MSWERPTIVLIWIAFIGALLAATATQAVETKQQLTDEIQKENNAVRKAKKEVKLSRLQFSDVQDAYSQGHFDDGTKLLNTFVETLEDAWKTLQSTGRIASKQPEGFRELEIALREDGRALEDLGRSIDYFNRAPLETAAKQLDATHAQLMLALFPGTPAKSRKERNAGTNPPAPPAAK